MNSSWNSDSEPDVRPISVQAFTPILGTLLLSSQVNIGGPARYAIVELLNRMRKANEREERMSEAMADEAEEEEHPIGLFGRDGRKLFRDEILHQVVIGIGKLDAPDEYEGQEEVHEELNDPELEQHVPQTGLGESPSRINDTVNPYFPIIPSSQPDAAVAQASTSTYTPPPSTSFEPAAATATPSVTAGMAASLHVSFAQLPVAPSPMATYQVEDHTTVTPAWLSSASHLSPPVTSDPPIPRQSNPYHLDNTGQHDIYYTENAGDMDAEDNFEGEDDEQAAVGRLSSMSLMAAVTASGRWRSIFTASGCLFLYNTDRLVVQFPWKRKFKLPLLEKLNGSGGIWSTG